MDYIAILERHLGFIGRFYEAVVEPLETKMHKIEVGEEPFEPRYAPEDYDGPEYESEWMEASEFVRVIGSTSLGLLEKALHDYLWGFVKREGGKLPEKKKRESWFDRYCRFLECNTRFHWENSPVRRSHLEEINLSRNDFTHNDRLGSTWPLQSQAHLKNTRFRVLPMNCIFQL
jgi:hypothetical protein